MLRNRLSMPLACIALSAWLAGCNDANNPQFQEYVPPSSVTIVPSASPEGALGEMSTLSFRVLMTEPQPQPVTLSYRVNALSATENQDYSATEGAVSIEPGALEARIDVALIGDSDEEPAETFELLLSSSANAELTASTVIGTIANDDSVCDSPYVKALPNRWRVIDADPLNYAHRGGVIDFPENTLYAYAEVAKVGADVLEMDVYQTADNELVILHDLDVDRTTDGTGNVVDLTLDELRALDAAYWFVPGVGTPRDRPAEDYVFRGIATGNKPPPPGYSAEDFRIPTLEEALRRFAAYLINVELKPDLDGSGNYEQQIADLLQRYGRFNDVIAASFVDEAANNFKAVAPCVHTSVPLDQGTGIVLGALGPATMPDVPEHVAFQVPPDTSQISQIPDDFFLEVVTPDFVADAHAVNLAVQVWTVNTCEEMLRMIDLGVDAIMTDRPVLLEEILNTEPTDRRCD
ncbi:MAG: glycerophosphodiester phosphodiesterase family protein [Pseudomonadales bacterium]